MVVFTLNDAKYQRKKRKRNHSVLTDPYKRNLLRQKWFRPIKGAFLTFNLQRIKYLDDQFVHLVQLLVRFNQIYQEIIPCCLSGRILQKHKKFSEFLPNFIAEKLTCYLLVPNFLNGHPNCLKLP